MTIKMMVNINYKGDKTIQETFAASFNYNSSPNKFKLSQYEKGIEESLINKIIEDFIIYLSNI